MQERHLYEYAVIRFVPRVEREEFINVGIVLFSKRCKYLKSLYTINENKLKLFSSELDVSCLKEGLLTAVKSSCIQVSRPHPGFSADLDRTLERLFEELVL